MKGMGRGSTEFQGLAWATWNSTQQGCHLPRSFWDPLATSALALWALGSKAALVEEDSTSGRRHMSPLALSLRL